MEPGVVAPTIPTRKMPPRGIGRVTTVKGATKVPPLALRTFAARNGKLACDIARRSNGTP